MANKTIPELDAAVSLNLSDEFPCSQSGNPAVKGTFAQLQTLLSGGVKKYVALLTQTGTDAPVATVLENSLGGVPVWSRVSVGKYHVTLAGAFADEAKIFTRIGNRGVGDMGWNNTYWIDANTIEINTLSVSDGNKDEQMEFCEFEILVYP